MADDFLMACFDENVSDETITAVANKAVAVEYMYAFISREQDRAYLIMRVADNETAIAALKAQGCDLLDGESVYQL